MDGNITAMEESNILLDRSTRQSISKDTRALNEELEDIRLMDLHSAFQPKKAEYTFFSSAHGILSRRYLMLGLSLTYINS